MMSDIYYKYIIVLFYEVVEGLVVKLNGIYIDGIFGCGGYFWFIFF